MNAKFFAGLSYFILFYFILFAFLFFCLLLSLLSLLIMLSCFSSGTKTREIKTMKNEKKKEHKVMFYFCNVGVSLTVIL